MRPVFMDEEIKLKFFHLADLHIGKRVNGFPMREDLEHIFAQIYAYAQKHQPDAVLIAGDVYDKTLPSAEAVAQFDGFLTEFVRMGIPVVIISGNHDSPERLEFAKGILQSSRVYLSCTYYGKADCVTLTDEYGAVNIYLLPFVRPAQVRSGLELSELHTYADAMRAAVQAMQIDTDQRNVLVTHQFVTGPDREALRSDSEIISVGGEENVPADCFDAFDYVALGHLHRPQSVGRDTVRYAGSPLKYSFSEAGHEKSVTMVTMAQKGSIEIEMLPLQPLHEMREICGTLDALIAQEIVQAAPADDYIHATLTDGLHQIEPHRKLSAVYPNLMRLDIRQTQSISEGEISAEAIRQRDPAQLFEDFYVQQHGEEMSGIQRKIVTEIFAQIQEETK